MNRFRGFSIPLTVLAAMLVCAPLAAQTANAASAGSRAAKPIVQVEQRAPFAAGGHAAGGPAAVRFLSAGQMTAASRALLAGARPAIAARADFVGMQFNQGTWRYRQIVCPALPNHLFLRFMRNDGASDRSVFSVSIPRHGHGQVRVIPVLRRSYALYSPAPVSKATIDAFNQIRSEEGAGPNSSWLGTALCYAALAGADPMVGPLTGTQNQNPSHPGFVELQIPGRGGAIIRFINQAARPQPTLWTMIFNAQGTLLKVKHVPAGKGAARMIPSASQQPVAFSPIQVKQTALKSGHEAQKSTHESWKTRILRAIVRPSPSVR
jgi:hypothetical protein